MIGWVGSIMEWVEFNGAEVSSRVKTETFGACKIIFVAQEQEEDERERCLVVNKLNDRSLKIGEI